jgi:hypothetical protein
MDARLKHIRRQHPELHFPHGNHQTAEPDIPGTKGQSHETSSSSEASQELTLPGTENQDECPSDPAHPSLGLDWDNFQDQGIDPDTAVTLDDISQHRRHFRDQSSFKSMHLATINYHAVPGRGRSSNITGSRDRRSDYSPYPGHRSVFSLDDSELENELASLPAGQETGWEQIYINEDTKPFQRGRGPASVISDSDTSAHSYANSALSTASLASSATDLSKHSGYSTLEIAEATKELITILRDDEDLALLYQRAICDINIGSAKLEKNLREYFKNYARLLMKEAGDSLEALASQLVLLKARHVAQSIVDKYGSKRAIPQRGQKSWYQDDSSDDETGKSSIDHSEFGDLVLFREFLVSNESFTLLRGQIISFVIPKSARREIVQAAVDQVKSSESETMVTVRAAAVDTDMAPSFVFYRNPLQSGKQMIETVLVTMGYKEPPLKAGFTRLRWRCVSALLFSKHPSQVSIECIGTTKLTNEQKCGDTLFGDVVEYREGGIARLIERMQRFTGAKITVTPYNAGSSNQRYTFRSPKCMQSLVQTASGAFKPRKASQSCLPQHNASSAPATAAPVAIGMTTVPQESVHLMACMQRGRYRRIVRQDSISEITTDKALFCFLRSQLAQHRGRVRKFFSLKCVQGLLFVKVNEHTKTLPVTQRPY